MVVNDTYLCQYAFMSPDQILLARASLDRRLSALKREALAVPPYGWLRAIREALGMTPQRLAERLGVSRTRINALEKAEVTGATTLKSLRDAAAAMDCVLVYAIVPKETLDATVRAQAAKKADQDLSRLHHTMRLEKQALGKDDLARARARLIERYLAGSPRKLWEES